MITEASGVTWPTPSGPMMFSAATGVLVNVTLPLADRRWPRLSQSPPNAVRALRQCRSRLSSAEAAREPISAKISLETVTAALSDWARAAATATDASALVSSVRSRRAASSASGAEIAAVSEFLRNLAASDCSPGRVRLYAFELLGWLRFLDTVDVSWDRASRAEARDYAL